MKRWRHWVLTTVLVVGCATTGPQLRDPGDSSLVFWSVADPSGTPVGYLLGTLHQDRLDAPPFDQAIEDALAGCEVLALEVAPPTLTRTPPPRTGRSWEEGTTDAEAAEIDRAADRVFSAPVRHLAPWLARLRLTSRAFGEAGYLADRGYEWHFIWRARDLELPVIELETGTEHLAALSAGTFDEQVELLLQTARGIDEIAADLDSLHAAYATGDLERLRILLRGDAESDGERALARAVFDERNPRLAERLAGLYAAPGCAFATIGAGHVVGPENVRSRLAEFGFVLERVTALGPAEEARLPLATEPAADDADLPIATIDLPPVERSEASMGGSRSVQLVGTVEEFRHVYSVTAVPKRLFVEELYATLERTLAVGGGFRRLESEEWRMAPHIGRTFTFASANQTFRGAMIYSKGFVHTFGVVGPSNRALEVSKRFTQLQRSFQLPRI